MALWARRLRHYNQATLVMLRPEPAGRPGLRRWHASFTLTLTLTGLVAAGLAFSLPTPPVRAQAPANGAAARVIVLVRAGATAPLADAAMEALPAHADGETRNAWRGRRDRALSEAAERAHGPVRDRVAAFIEARGGRVTHRFRLLPGLAATLPAGLVERLRRHPDVVSVHEDRQRRPLLSTLPATLGLSAFTNAGVTGGTVDVAVVDTGVFAAHRAFTPAAEDAPRLPVTIRSVISLAGCDIDTCPVDDLVGHGTAVAGVIASQGWADFPQHVGVARGLRSLVNVVAVGETGFVDSEVIGGFERALALDGSDVPEIFNASLGAVVFREFDAQDPYDREVMAQFADAVVAERGKVVVVAAGNSGGFQQSVESPAIGYNVLAVGAAAATGPRPTHTVWANSARGPAMGPKDAAALRRKPDLVAPGPELRTTDFLGGLTDGTDTEEAIGTSLAAPVVSGLAALLFDLPDLGDGTVGEVSKALAVRALLINSAEDRNQFHPALMTPDGWDPAWGWGYVDGAAAYAQRRGVSIGAIDAGAARRFFLRASAAASTKATLAWNRPVTFSATPPLKNLDLRLYGYDLSAATAALRASSTSTVDNVEQVTTSAATEPAVLVVEGNDTFASGQSTTFALAHNGGFVAAFPPQLAVALSAPTQVAAGGTFPVTATVSNPAGIPGVPVVAATVTLALPAGYTLDATSAPSAQALPVVAAGASQQVQWRVRAPAAVDAGVQITALAGTGAFGVPLSASAATTVQTTAACDVTVAPASIAAPAEGLTAAIAIGPSGLPPACGWLATSSVPWATFPSGASGSGPGSVQVAVAPNPGHAARQGTVSVGGATVTLTQAPAPRRYYLSEGATGFIFDLDIAIANPNDEPVPVEVTFLRPGGQLAPISQDFTLAAKAQRVISVDAIPELASTDVSTVVTSPTGAPLVVERTMFWDGTSYGGHGGTAVDGPRTRWYFAEGSQGFFDTFVLLANANDQPANVTVTFLREGGQPPHVHATTVKANSRDNVWTYPIPELANSSFAMVVDSDIPVIAERAMYFPGFANPMVGKRLFEGGHESAGVAEPATSWFHAEGATGPLFDEYILVGNPGTTPAEVTFTFLLDSGQTVVARGTVPAEGRFTLNVELLEYYLTLPPDKGGLTMVSGDPSLLRATAVSTTVTSDVPVISERAMYWGGAYPNWYEAHNSFGVTQAALRWGLAEGRVGGARNFFTYMLLANPNAADVPVRVTLLRQGGRAPIVRTFTVKATSRFNVFVSLEPNADDPIGWAAFGLQAGEGFGAIVESLDPASPIAVERAMYWFAADPLFWTGGTNATAVALP